MTYKTLRSDNEFMFDCPTLHEVLGPVKMSDCAQTYYHFMRGEKVGERACHALMAASKCPLMTIVRSMQRNREDGDIYFSETPKHGKLAPHVLDDVAPVIVLPMHAQAYGVDATMTSVILDRVHVTERAGVSSSPSPAKVRKSPVRERAPLPESKASSSDIAKAASSGDMAAALTAAVAEESKRIIAVPITPPPKPVVAATGTPKPVSPAPATSAHKPTLLELARMKKKAAS